MVQVLLKLLKIQFGAKQGIGVGFTGQCWAVPTKDHRIQTMNLTMIQEFIDLFIKEAVDYRNDLEFLVTRIGCGLAGYTDKDIAPLFRNAPKNCIFHKDWEKYLE